MEGMTPSPEQEPRLSLESLEERLRALPPPKVPEALPSKLIATIPAAKAAGSVATGIIVRWLWIAGLAAACITAPVAIVTWWTLWNSKPRAESNENGDLTEPSATRKNMTRSSKAVIDYEQTLRFDPYNADAWFGLAKAQAELDRRDDAISSAQKALDIARSRNRSDLVSAIETWRRSYRAKQTVRSAP
jgi:tetratricopeptide (TPR) repeat protein